MTEREIDNICFQIDQLNRKNVFLRDKISRLKTDLRYEANIHKQSSGDKRRYHSDRCFAYEKQINELNNELWMNEKEIEHLQFQLPRQKSTFQQSPKQQSKPTVQSGSYVSNTSSKASSNSSHKTSKFGHFLKFLFYTFLSMIPLILSDELMSIFGESLGENIVMIVLAFLVFKVFYHIYKSF